MFLTSKSKKAAVALSYLSLIVQTVSTMVLTRFYLDRLGADTYGLYQMIYSVAQYILILDLGIATVMTRYIPEYEANNDHKRAENFAAHFAVIVSVLVTAVAAIGITVNCQIENIYQNLTAQEYEVSHQLFTVMIVQLAATIISHYFRGICEAYERFTFTRTITICQVVLNFVLAIVFVHSGMGVMGIALANTVVIVLNMLVTMVYAMAVVKFRVRFHYWDSTFFRPVMLLMLAMLLQAVIGHVSSTVDKTILGIMSTKTSVAVYSVAATIITMFNTLPSAISSVFQPSATRLVVEQADTEKMTDFVIRPGRIQFMITGGFIAGFVLVGKDFITCWAGADMVDAWQYVLLILVPNMIPLIQNTCLSILNAMDKRIYRSIILVAITGVNIGLTIALIPIMGPIGAPLATGVSYLLGHGLLMNIYYAKCIGLNVGRMFKSIFSRTWLCVLAAFALTVPLMWWRCNGSWLILIVKAVIFCAVYGVALFAVGMNPGEKDMVKAVLDKLLRKTKKS